jgi:glycosyltransferase involved in cell wall biosynthesis
VTPLVSVIVPARDAAATLPDVLAGLAVQSVAGGFEVIVIDDASADATRSLAASCALVDRVIRTPGIGPGRARNAGAAVAAGSQLAFLDADCTPASGWLQAGSEALVAGAALVLGEIRPRPDRPLGPFDRTLSVVGVSPLFESANLFVQRELFEALGGFESWLGPRAGKELGEDVWLGWRARRAGARIAACPAALAHHEVYRRGAAGYVAERWRLRFFPAMTERMPELRRALFYRRLFLSKRSAAFDAALLGLAAAAAARRPAFAAAALPYAWALSRDAREPGGLLTAGARAAADGVGLAALIIGSIRSRSPLL